MALLDVSEVIDDPLFSSPVTLVRTKEATDGEGNPSWEDEDSVEAQAVVTADTKALARLPDELRREGTILVRVLKKVAPEGFGSGYDAILWRGKRFVVRDCADYSHFGAGFLRLTCWPEGVSDGGY